MSEDMSVIVVLPNLSEKHCITNKLDKSHYYKFRKCIIIAFSRSAINATIQFKLHLLSKVMHKDASHFKSCLQTLVYLQNPILSMSVLYLRL